MSIKFGINLLQFASLSHFKNIYKDIYNRHNTSDELNRSFVEIKNTICRADSFISGKVTNEMIENIVNNFKFGKK